MHILIIPSERYLPQDSPLAGIFQRHQAKALVQQGHKVGIVSPDLFASRLLEMLKIRISEKKNRESIYLDGEILVYKKRTWVWERFISIYSEVWIETGLKIFRKYIRHQGTPDLIHAHNALYAGFLAQAIKRQYGVPFVITEHSSIFRLGNLSQENLSEIGHLYNYSDTLIAVSPRLGNLLSEKTGANTWIYVPNMVDPDLNIALGESISCKDSRKEINILSISRLEKHKGLSVLIEAFSRMKHRDKAILHIAGNGPEMDSLKRLSYEHGICENTCFYGHLNRDEIESQIRHADFLILPSFYETFGVVLIEALAYGKPVISTYCSGPECIINDKNGILVEPGDSEALAKAMEFMIDNIHVFDAKSIQADCLGRFGHENVTRQLINIYEQVVGAFKSGS